MQHISQLTTQRPEKLGERTETAQQNGLTDAHIAKFWLRMTMIYGHKWTSSFSARDDGTWLKGLGDVTPEQIGIGLEKCRTSGEGWPPTLPDFRAMCLPPKPLASYHRPFPVLPPPKVTRETVIEHRRKMLEIVGLDPGRAEVFDQNESTAAALSANGEL